MQIETAVTAFYNRAELCSKLDLDERCGDETLLERAYTAWGERCHEHLLGDFAFALYDEKRECFFCARDPLGIKPLYYTEKENQYYFANDLDELFRKSKTVKHPNKEMIRSLLHQNGVAYEATMYEGVYRLPPGHWMSVEKVEKQLYRYWRPETIKVNYQITKAEAATRFLELFDEAIRCRIDEVETTAFELSGGLDSSSVVSWLRHNNPEQPLNVYTMRFGELSCDEGQYIDAVASEYDFVPKSLRIDQTDYSSQYDMTFNYMVNPHWPILVTYTMVFPVVEQMKREGISTIITGQGGDHVLTGNPYVLTELLKRFKLLELMGNLYLMPNRRNKIKNYLVLPFLGEKTKKVLKWALGRRSQISQHNVHKFKRSDEATSGLSLAFVYDLNTVTGPLHALMMDAAAFHAVEKAFGVEYRHPFFDVRLVEFMLSLPPEFKVGRGRIKHLLRLAMKGILPEKIRTRSGKAEFSDVLLQQINAIDLSPLFDDPEIVRMGWIGREEIELLYGKYHNRLLSAAEILKFWRYINVEYWYRHTFVSELGAV
ncbi:MAG: hypothetical protein JW682_05135 [Campylobacterales bacterium]|nr:hypothetical protein [Campylobacterales bacterium]HEO99073.1 hypothetical protein [Campylobacterota bacterium]